MIQSIRYMAFLLLFGFLLTGSLRIEAQAVHFSHFDKAGFLINPAEAGSFYGTARIGGIYRDQYRKVSSHPYKTSMLYVDSPVSFVRKNGKDWIGVGGMMYIDQTGIGSLNTNSFNASVAYHHALGGQYKNIVSVAGSCGYMTRSNDLGSGKLFFEDEVDASGSISGQTSSDRNLYAKNVAHIDVSAGLRFRSQIAEDMGLTLGASVSHLNRPTIQFGDDAYKMPLRFNAVASFDKRFGEKFTLTPKAFFAKMGSAQQIQIQAMAGYRINPSFVLKGGLGTRVGDAVQAFFGAEFNRFDVGVGYDYTISDLANANSGGALELALSYVFVKEKKATPKPKLICPQL